MSFNNTPKSITLCCVVEGENLSDNSFRVSIDTSAVIDDLKQEIKKCQAPAFNHIAPSRLVVFRDSIPITDIVAARSNASRKLSAMDTIFECWPEQPREQKTVHVVIGKHSINNEQGDQLEQSKWRAPKQEESSQRLFEEDDSAPKRSTVVLHGAQNPRALHSVFSVVGGQQWNGPPANYNPASGSPKPTKPPPVRLDVMTDAVGADVSYSVFSAVAGDQHGTPQVQFTEEVVRTRQKFSESYMDLK